MHSVCCWYSCWRRLRPRWKGRISAWKSACLWIADLNLPLPHFSVYRSWRWSWKSDSLFLISLFYLYEVGSCWDLWCFWQCAKAKRCLVYWVSYWIGMASFFSDGLLIWIFLLISTYIFSCYENWSRVLLYGSRWAFLLICLTWSSSKNIIFLWVS